MDVTSVAVLGFESDGNQKPKTRQRAISAERKCLARVQHQQRAYV